VGGANRLVASAGAGAAGLAGEEWVAGPAAFADLGGDPAPLEFGSEWVAAVAAVGPELGGLVAGSAERVDEREEVGAFVLVAGAEPEGEWPALGVDGEVVFA